MTISVEISYYAFQRDYNEVIDQFISAIEKNENILLEAGNHEQPYYRRIRGSNEAHEKRNETVLRKVSFSFSIENFKCLLYLQKLTASIILIFINLVFNNNQIHVSFIVKKR